MTGQQFYQDATVYDADGERIGTLAAYDPQGGYLVVQKGFLFHTDLYIPADAVQTTDGEGNIHLSLHKAALQDDRYSAPPAGGTAGVVSDDSYAQSAPATETIETTTRAPVGADDTIDVPVYEEELVVGKRREQVGDVHLHKEVVTEQESIPVALRREEVTVERVPVDQGLDPNAVRDAFRDQDIDVPVMGEEAIVGKQAHEVEEVRLRKSVTQEQRQVTDTVRKERVAIEGVDEQGQGRSPRRR